MFRKSLFWLHLVAGILGGIVIFIMCVTGAALSFEKNILENIEHDQRFVTVSGERLPPAEVLRRVTEQRPDFKPSSYTEQADPGAAVAIAGPRGSQIFADPYTGNITGEGSKSARAFFGFMTDLHRWLAMSGDGRWLGKAVTGASNLMFLLLAITGIYIWFPREMVRKHIRPRLWFKAGAVGKARDFNWHTTIGFWSSLVLIVLTVTAAVISYQWAGNLVYTVTGNEVPKPQPQQPAPDPNAPKPPAFPSNINELWTSAATQAAGARSLSLRLPVTKDATFTVDEGKDWNKFGRGTLSIDPATAAVTKWEPYAAKNSAAQLRSWMRFTHTGESFGIIGQIIGFIACIGGAFLVYTGVALALRRFAAFLRRRNRPEKEFGRSDNEGPLRTIEV